MLNGGKVEGKKERIFEKEKDSDLEGVGKQEGERGKVFIGYGKRRSTGIKRVRKELGWEREKVTKILLI